VHPRGGGVRLFAKGLISREEREAGEESNRLVFFAAFARHSFPFQKPIEPF
jgi:hypothetical protein